MKGTGVARRYAKALLDLAARDGIIAEVGAQLRQHQELLVAHAEVQKVLNNPSVHGRIKRSILAALLERTQPLPLLRNFLLLLLQKDRLRYLEQIVWHYQRLADERLGRVAVEVITAVELEPEWYEALAQKIAAATQKREVNLERRVDPSILGGVVVRVDHLIVDGSLQGQLARLREELIGG